MGQICSDQSWACTVMFLWGKKQIQVLCDALWLCYFYWEIRPWLGENVGHSSEHRLLPLSGQEMRWQDVKDSNLCTLQFVGLYPCICAVGGKGHVVGDEQDEVSNAKCQKKTQVPQWCWNVSEIKTCSAFTEVALCLHKQRHSELGLAVDLFYWFLYFLSKNWFTSCILEGFLKFHSDFIAAF